VGSYVKYFDVDASLLGKETFISFQGVETAIYVWLNGEFVGYAEDSYLPSEFDITDKLRPGKNNIAVRVYRFTSGSFLECQDYWRMTGITRDVYLWSAPKTRIDDFFFRTTALKDGNSAAESALTVAVSGTKMKKATLEAQLLDGSRVLATQTASVTTAGEVELTFPTVTGITAWSAEKPQLYDLVISLKQKGKEIDVRALKVGFRTVGVREDGALLVNGNRVVFHGVNRHSFSEYGGRTLTKAEMETDLLQMKRLNVNAVRTSHYPNNPYVYDLADRLGLYVLAEANVECHANLTLSHNKEFRPAMVERSVRQVRTLRNHASIIMWSAGNESGNGENFKYVMDTVMKVDPTRLTHYEGNSNWSSVTSTMYGPLGLMANIARTRLEEYKQGKQGIRPHVQCENTHAMGNSMGNQREFYDIYENYPAMAGEFVWDWKDQGLKVSATDAPMKFESLGRKGEGDVVSILDIKNGEYWAYGGDFGDRPSDNNFCCNGVVLADNSPTAKSYEMKKIYQPIDFVMKDSVNGVFTLKSKLQQRVLDDLNVSYVLLEDGMEIGRGEIKDVVLDIGQTRDVTLAKAKALVEAPQHPGAEYHIRFIACQKKDTEWAKAGFEVASEQILLSAATDRKPYEAAKGSALQIIEKSNAVTIAGDNFSVAFVDGLLSSYTVNGKNMLAAPLTLQAFRLPTDNERGRTSTYDRMGIRKLDFTPGKLEVTVAKDKQSATVVAVNSYATSGNNRFIVHQTIDVMADGVLIVNATIDPLPKGSELPRLGLRAELPKEYEYMTWLGRGPHDSYADRKESAFVGLHHSRVSDEWTNYVLPQEHGNKEEVRWITITDEAGTGLMVVAPERIAASAGHWRPEDNYVDGGNRKKHPNEVDFCDQTILNLDAYNRALGNGSCGPDVIEKYRVPSAKAHLNLLLMPITQRQSDRQLAERARVISPVCSPASILAEKGLVTINCTTPDATIHYSIDGGNEQVYTAPFNLVEGGMVRAYITAPNRKPSPMSEENVGAYLSKKTWRVVSYSSQQSEGGEGAKNTIDENPGSIWHTQYSPTTPKCPHEVVVDMGTSYQVGRFLYQGRQDMTNGRVARFEFYVSDNLEDWGNPVCQGHLESSTNVQEIELASPKRGRYFRFVALSTHDGMQYVSTAELGIVPVADSKLVAKKRRK
jgi:beta-galactosidase